MQKDFHWQSLKRGWVVQVEAEARIKYKMWHMLAFTKCVSLTGGRAFWELNMEGRIEPHNREPEMLI